MHAKMHLLFISYHMRVFYKNGTKLLSCQSILKCEEGLMQGLAIAFYIVSSILFDYFSIQFVVTVLREALDFWVVKNVSGRILVGLRWWNEVNDHGESIWRYESLDQQVRFC